ncbi:dinitrogenase iron-molybdenum cofactor biosynthesis protein [Spirochaetia bacterium]|nr:dinitrogenase iron-molybdenum cofactor biosynthesis protein [Spirochaetia bacterium]
MPWRVAVTSADGVLINQHFGHATSFFIYDIDRLGIAKLAERRDVEPWCNRDAQGKDAEEGDSGIAGEIADCIAVLTARIGPPARRKLELAGLSVFDLPDRIDEALKKLAAYYVKTNRAENS